MKKTKFYKQLNPARLAQLDGITCEQFEQLQKSAGAAVRALSPFRFSNLWSFKEGNAFISSSGSLHGFYLPSETIEDTATGRRLLLVAFVKTWKRYKDGEKLPREEWAEEFAPVLVFEDEAENLFTLESAEIGKASDAEKFAQGFREWAQSYRAQADAWRKVTRATKKGGGDFAILQKNIVGAAITHEEAGGILSVDVAYWNGNHREGGRIFRPIGSPCSVGEFFAEHLPARIAELERLAEECDRRAELAPVVYAEIMGAIAPALVKWGTPSNAEGVFFERIGHDVAEWVKYCLHSVL